MLEQLLADLQAEEGWREYLYDDHDGQPIKRNSVVRGHPTIGYGFCVEDGIGKPLPRSIADAWLRYLAADVWAELTVRLPWLMAQPEEVQRGCCALAYQIGVSGLLRFERMLAALRAEDRETAASEALNSRWSTQTPARARRVAELIGGPSWAGPS